MLNMQGPLAKTNVSSHSKHGTDVDCRPLLLMWEVDRIIYSSREGRVVTNILPFQAPD